MSRVVRIDNYTKTNAKKTRVAAYARVSTDNTEQLASLESQKKYYDSYIKSHKEWEFAGLFFDEGISGTKTDKREGLLRMLEECRRGNIDFIIVKSISRLARNTVDCLEIVRELYDLGIYLYFEKENINTSKMQSELLLTILSGIAEGESKSISKNEKWSVQKRYEQGKFIIGYPPYGYKNVKGEMIVVPEEAEIVRWIFKEYLAGSGSYTIAGMLNEKEVKPKRGEKWTPSAVNGLLKNEKFTGDVLYQKSYTDEQFNRHRNKGEKEQYYVQNHHEAIISHEDFEKVQELMMHQRGSKGIEVDTGKYQNRYPFSGKIICGTCGTTWKRRTHYTKSQGEYYTFVCESHIKDKERCGIKFIREKDIEASFCNMMNKLIFGKKIIFEPILSGMSRKGEPEVEARITEIEKELEEIVNRKAKLMQLFMKQYLDSEAYSDEITVISEGEEKLKDELDALRRTQGLNSLNIEQIEKLYKFADKGKPLTKFSAKQFSEYVDHIIVEDRHLLVFVMKCGLELKEAV